MKHQFKLGDRVRLKPPARVWGDFDRTRTATYLWDGRALPDSYATVSEHPADCLGHDVCACDWQWAKMRDQTPNPSHTAAVEHFRESR